ncbi:MAG: DUF481 domain-containing protein [Myxococcota bacterium]
MAAAALVAAAPGSAVAQAPERVEGADGKAAADAAEDAEQAEQRKAEGADAADEGAEAADDALPDEAATEEATPDEPEVDPTDVTDAGVPDAPVEPDKAVAEVEKAVQQVEEAVQKAEESPKEALPGEYTIEFGDTFDWLRLSSGEWLKGEFQWMRDDEFGFDSDDLDLVTDDWEKVARLHSPRVHTYAFLDGTDLIGRAVITPDQIIVETIDGVVTMPRNELLGVIDGGRRERDFWYLRLGVGFSSSIGNTSQGSLNGNFELGRADQRSIARLTYDGTVGYADREETVNRHIGRADYRIFLTKRYYVVPITGEFFNDRFANIRIRANPAVAGGVHLFDTPKAEWDTELSLGYQYLRYLSTIDGVPNPQNDFFIGFLNVWSFDLGALDLDLSWQTALVVTTIGNTNHQGSAVISVEITEILDLDATFYFYRTEQPGPRSDGTVPQKNDYQFVVGLTLEIG